VVVEDAISGVQAGADGGFGLTIGVARSVAPDLLREAGADVVVRDLEEISLDALKRKFEEKAAA
jgi:beta-phosphoglucomutase-like phosphatase (HAD superfamily)